MYYALYLRRIVRRRRCHAIKVVICQALIAPIGAVPVTASQSELLADPPVTGHGRRPAPKVAAIPSSQWPTRALGPANSRLSCDRYGVAFGCAPPPWPYSLNQVLTDLLA